MTLFGSKKKEVRPAGRGDGAKKEAPLEGVKVAKVAPVKVAKKSKEVALPRVSSGEMTAGNYSADVILRPRITEKSGLLSQQGIYTFEVIKTATKNSVSRAVFSTYKVMPVKVAMINLPAKKVILRGRRGIVAGMRKAVVTLRKGDKIDFV